MIEDLGKILPDRPGRLGQKIPQGRTESSPKFSEISNTVLNDREVDISVADDAAGYFET